MQEIIQLAHQLGRTNQALADIYARFHDVLCKMDEAGVKLLDIYLSPLCQCCRDIDTARQLLMSEIDDMILRQ